MAPERNAEMGTTSRRKSNSSTPPTIISRTYTTRKTVAQGMLDVALLLANGSQLKALLQTPNAHHDVLYVPQLALIGLSVTLQICVGILIIVLGNMEARTEEAQRRVVLMNNTTVALILIITVVNVFISAFGIKVSSHEFVYTDLPSGGTTQKVVELAGGVLGGVGGGEGGGGGVTGGAEMLP